MCFQTGQSTPLSSARLPFFLSLPPTIALCKKPPAFPPHRQPFSPLLLLPLFAPLSHLCGPSSNITCLSILFSNMNDFVHLLHVSETRYWSHQKLPALIKLNPRRSRKKTRPTGEIKINAKCWCLFIFHFNVTTTEALDSYVTPNTAMLTAEM